MIYVFAFVREVCTLPGKACLAAAEACGRIEELFTGPLKHCVDGASVRCAEAGTFFKDLVDRPLSTYVLVAVVLSVAGLRACFNALQNSAIGYCEASGSIGIRLWLYVQMGFACLNLFFAPYFQNKVWQVLSQDSEKLPANMKGQVHIPAVKVHETFRLVLLHDIPIGFYIVGVWMSFVWSWMGIDVAAGPGCNPDGWPLQACNFGMYFFWVAVSYTASYYFCGCCASSVLLHRPLTNEIPVPSAPPLDGFPAPAGGAWKAAAAAPAGAPAAAAPPRPPPRPGAPRAGFSAPLSCLCALILPPVGVFLRFGCSRQFVICALLTSLGFAPGVIYACVMILCEGTAQGRESGDLEGQDHYIEIK